MAANASLEITNLNKKYGDATVVSDVCLDIKKGEFMTFLGPSGSGKTTVLSMIAGFVEPTSGEILLAGEPLIEKPPHKRHIGMVFQQYSLFPHMTIFKNIAYPLKMKKISKAEIETRVMEILKLVELERFKDRYPRELSGGQQQRVALGRALASQPDILLMDEPLSALDKKLKESMQLEIRRLHQQLGLTVVFVTHDQEEALKMSDRITVFNNGRVEQVGSPYELYHRPATKFVAGFLGDSNMFGGKVVENQGEQVKIKLTNGDTMMARSDRGLSIGQEVTVMIRPENVVLHKQLMADKPPHNFFPCSLLESIYAGDSVKYNLSTSSGGKICVKCMNASGEQNSLSPGDIVYVTWKPENCIVLAE